MGCLFIKYLIINNLKILYFSKNAKNRAITRFLNLDTFRLRHKNIGKSYALPKPTGSVQIWNLCISPFCVHFSFCIGNFDPSQPTTFCIGILTPEPTP